MNRIDFFANTDVGKVRKNNDDQSFAAQSVNGFNTIGIVCDGMGGEARGDYASKLAIDIISEKFNSAGFLYKYFPTRWFRRILNLINKTVFDFGDRNEEYTRMGTTFVGALLRRDKLIIANVGDSRCYLSTSQGLRQITTDQTYVEFLYKTGQIAKNQIDAHPKKHVLMNAIGSFPSINVDVFSLNYGQETIMLCSDGLYNAVSESEIWAVLESDRDAETKTKLLIQLANHNGGPDNISICIIQPGGTKDD